MSILSYYQSDLTRIPEEVVLDTFREGDRSPIPMEATTTNDLLAAGPNFDNLRKRLAVCSRPNLATDQAFVCHRLHHHAC